MNKKDHWENVYQKKNVDEVSWYQAHPECSLRLIQSVKLKPTANIIDVGGGASKLVDYLLDEGYQNLFVLDISGQALKKAKERLGDRYRKVQWIESDVTEYYATKSYDLWHDRAVFHFLTNPEDRAKYLETMGRSLTASAYVVIATFALNGPEKCSGLPIERYNVASLKQTLGKNYQLLLSEEEIHQTPSGNPQQFVYCLFRKIS